MRGSARRCSRGCWEPTVDPGRRAEGRWVRSFRTVRGTRTEAERVLNGILREADVGGGQLSPCQKLGDLVERWLKERVFPRLRSQTCRWYERTVRLYLLPELGEIPVDRLIAAQISGMEARLAVRGVSPIDPSSAAAPSAGVLNGGCNRRWVPGGRRYTRTTTRGIYPANPHPVPAHCPIWGSASIRMVLQIGAKSRQRVTGRPLRVLQQRD